MRWFLREPGSYPRRRPREGPRADGTRGGTREGEVALTIKVVLADDNVLVREGVRALLDASDGIEFIGVASDAPTLIEAANLLQPDVVVTDIKMPPLFQLEG